MPRPEEAKMIFALQRPSDASPEPVPASQLRSSPGLVIPGAKNETVQNMGKYWKLLGTALEFFGSQAVERSH